MADGSSSANTSAGRLSTANERSSTPRNEATTSEASSCHTKVTSQEIVLTKSTGLGIAITGGIDRPGEGVITVADIIPGGDCHKDGRLHVGDTLLSINADSLEGVTHEAAINILTDLTLNHDVKSIVLRYRPLLATGNFVQNLRQPGSYTMQAGQSSTLPATRTPHMVQGSSQSMPHLRLRGDGAGRGRESGDPRRFPVNGRIDDRMEGLMQGALRVNGRATEVDRSLLKHGTAVPAHLSHSHPSLSPVRPGMASPHQASLNTASAQACSRPSQERQFSIASSEKLKIDKLHVALEYLGLHLTTEQKLKLQNQLHVDADGMVSYGEFVSAAKQMFHLSLNKTNLDVAPTFSHDEVDTGGPGPLAQLSPENMSVTIPVTQLELLKLERDAAVREARKYLGILQDNERTFIRAEEELLRVRRDAQAALHESRALKSRVHLAEAAHKEARSMEMDYEDVVRMLETEVGQLRKLLKEQTPFNKSKTENAESLHERLATLGAELRKSEAARKKFEVATERLLKFAELVYDNAAGEPTGEKLTALREPARHRANGTHHPPDILGRHRKRGTVNLATEAKEVVKAVKALIDVELM